MSAPIYPAGPDRVVISPILTGCCCAKAGMPDSVTRTAASDRILMVSSALAARIVRLRGSAHELKVGSAILVKNTHQI